MRTLAGLSLLVLAALVGILELIALADPAATAMANDADPYAPPPPWYIHAFWLTTTGAMIAWGLRLLNRGILGRLVRGRGFTPAER